MPRPRILPDNDELLRLINVEHMTYEQIAQEFGTTKSAVAWRVRQMGKAKPQNSYKHLRPWRVKAVHEHAYPSLMLRYLGRREAGIALSDMHNRMLDRWLEELAANRLVVTYDPEIPPNPASPKTGGWAYVPKRRQDRGIIRVLLEKSPDAKWVPLSQVTEPAKPRKRKKAS